MKAVNKIRILIASPGDVVDERIAVKRVIDELSTVLINDVAVELDAVMYETHAVSGVGSDVQEVINRYVDDHDIFLGIMWARLGSPSQRAESGTVEEYERSLARYRNDQNAMKIMFFLKEAALPYDIDLEQVAKVRAFKEKLGRDGVYAPSFHTVEELVLMIRNQLTAVVKQVIEERAASGGDAEESRDNHTTDTRSMFKSETVDLDDLGYIDLQVRAGGAIAKVTEISSEITHIQEEFGVSVDDAKSVFNRLSGLSTSAKKAVLDRAYDKLSQRMIEFTGELTKNAELHWKYSSDAIADWSRALLLKIYHNVVDRKEIEHEISSVTTTLQSLSALEQNIDEFISTLQAVLAGTARLRPGGRQFVDANARFLTQIRALIVAYQGYHDLLKRVRDGELG